MGEVVECLIIRIKFVLFTKSRYNYTIMKQIIETYKNNRDVVEHFITRSMSHLNLKKLDEKSSKRAFVATTCVKMIYGVDAEYTLNTPYYHKNKIDGSKIGLTKSHYFERVSFNIDGTYLSNPYINASDGTAGITYAIKVDDGFIVVDMNLLCVLQQLKLVGNDKFMSVLNKCVYGFMGFSLLLFSLFLGLYALYIFFQSLMSFESFKLDSTFQAIIALTLGLAIYDLAKTILEHEIFFKTVAIDDSDSNEMLSKFLKSIIIALSIESLMVVFKIALNDHTELIHALFLIIGVSMMIYVLGKFNHMSSIKN